MSCNKASPIYAWIVTIFYVRCWSNSPRPLLIIVLDWCPKKNDFGYFIQDKCSSQNKPYNEVKVRLLNKDMETCMNECVKMVEKMNS